jgi:hypothetical protein
MKKFKKDLKKWWKNNWFGILQRSIPIALFLLGYYIGNGDCK